jgi:hypothetical protein
MQQADRSRPAVCRVLCLARPVSRAMFSKPLAYPSTLDRRPPGCATRERRPTWRGFGARVSCSNPENTQAKAHAYSQALFHAASRRSLSPSGGASIRSYVFFKLGITSWSYRLGPFQRRKATRWVALDWLGMRLGN